MAAPYSHIACCFDGSEASEAAVAEGLRLLGDGGGRLSVIHVHHDPPTYGGMYQPDLGAVRETAARWFDGRVVVDVDHGEPAAVVAQQAQGLGDRGLRGRRSVEAACDVRVRSGHCARPRSGGCLQPLYAASIPRGLVPP